MTRDDGPRSGGGSGDPTHENGADAGRRRTDCCTCCRPGVRRGPELATLERTFTYRQGDVALGDGLAIVRVPERFRYLGPDDAKRLLEDGWYNPPGDVPLGMLIPADVSPFSDEGWGVVITFEEDGYVDDDDASTIDFDELLADMQRDVRDESEAREEAGYEPIALIGRAAPPHYDATSHKHATTTSAFSAGAACSC